MKVGVVGTGPVGLGCAALADANGHEAIVWSPRAPEAAAPATREIETVGLFEHRCRVPVATGPAALADCDVVIFCVLGNGHRIAFERVAPHLRAGQSVIISSHCSLGALYLSRLLATRGVRMPIIAWATTLTGGPIAGGRVQVRLLRRELEVATVPASAIQHGLDVSRSLCKAVFHPSPNLLAIALSNLNPPIHMANAMLNFTRMQRGEAWDNYGCITEGVGRLIEGLDEERLAIAARFGVRVRSAREHFLKSFADLVPGTVAEMAAQVEVQRKGGSPGPATANTRYVSEDLPFGIHPVIELGRAARVPTPLHEAGLKIFSTIYGRDFAAENDLLPRVGLEGLDAARLIALAERGWRD
jgi:opine dehydrogenase